MPISFEDLSEYFVIKTIFVVTTLPEREGESDFCNESELSAESERPGYCFTLISSFCKHSDFRCHCKIITENLKIFFKTPDIILLTHIGALVPEVREARYE